MKIRSSRVRSCTSPWQRMRGLMFTQPGPDVLVFPQCNDVHTYLMNYALDIAFIDRAGQVVASFRGVGPGCRLRQDGAWAVVERASSRLAPWYEQGAYVDTCVLRAAQGKES